MRPLKFSEEFDALAIVEAAKLRDAYAPSRPASRLLKDTEESVAGAIAKVNEFTPLTPLASVTALAPKLTPLVVVMLRLFVPDPSIFQI